MELIFLALYDYFRKNRPVLFGLFIVLTLLAATAALRIHVEEDISRFFPNDKKLEKLNEVFRQSKLLDKLVVMVSLSDSTKTSADSLIAYADALASRMETDLSPYIKKITVQVDDEVAFRIFQAIHRNIPVFLDSGDYAAIDSLTTPQGVKFNMQKSYRQLISPTGIALKKMIIKDPLGISFLALKKLQHLQYDENYELVDGHILTRDHRYLVFFVVPAFPPNDTGHNSSFLNGFDETIRTTAKDFPGIRTLYFGAAAAAVGNAAQLRADTILTVSLMVVLLLVFLLAFLRKKQAPVLILIPVVFGGLFSLSIIYLIQGTISVLAVAAGSIILGIAVNYSLHFLSHLRHAGNVGETIRDLVKPMTIGSATTVLAFLCLQFANAAILRDVGLFAGFSLIGAALCSLIFLPHLVSDDYFAGSHPPKWINWFTFYKPSYNRILVPVIVLLTPLMLYFAGDVLFNSDMSQLNYMSPSMRESEETMNRINRGSLRSVYIIAEGADMESALRRNESIIPILNDLRHQGVVSKFASLSSFVLSDSLQHVRIRKWNTYWTAEKKAAVLGALAEEGEKLRFTRQAIANFDSLLNLNYTPAPDSITRLFRSTFFDDYITETNGHTTLVTLASVDYDRADILYKRLQAVPNVTGLDRRMVTTLFVSYLHDDFTFIVAFTSALVFFVLLLSYGRLELTLITFVPMLVTWIWILGFMALFGIEFNIINVMVSTFIFGLGDDYSIFIMDGLQQEYTSGKHLLPSIRDSIFLSAITTICGLGVLIFAQHPALRSIAAISIIGILCVFVMSLTLEPYLFDKIIAGRARKNLPPFTLFGFCTSALIYFNFALGSFLLTFFGLLIRIIPVGRKRLKVFYHSLIRMATLSLIYSGPHVKKNIINSKGQYDTPKVIIANHESFLDILLTTMLHPKVLLFTNRWVWNSPIFGGVVRLADYYPVEAGSEYSIEKLRDRVADGYSILVFPEGSRSAPGSMKRFHKGAFYLAEKLQLEILPLLLHGTGHSVPKGEFYVQAGQLTMKFLAPIPPSDLRFGTGYFERTKSISRYFKEEHRLLTESIETPYYFRHRLISTFLYKGPVLEWYLRIKLKLEDYYNRYHELIPRTASVLDLGCGYGYISYLLHFTSTTRTITGVDFDEDKIAVARCGYTRGEQLQFECADITTFQMQRYDAILISDVLHYLTPDQQRSLLLKCFDALLPGGKLLVRDADRDLSQKQKGTEVTEFFSVHVMRFNKARQPLHFISGQEFRDFVRSQGLEIRTWDDTKYTSNVTFVVEKKGAHSSHAI